MYRVGSENTLTSDATTATGTEPRTDSEEYEEEEATAAAIALFATPDEQLAAALSPSKKLLVVRPSTWSSLQFLFQRALVGRLFPIAGAVHIPQSRCGCGQVRRMHGTRDYVGGH